MKKITLSLFLLLFSLISFSQVPIGNGNNEAQQLPFDPYYGYTYSQSIYLSSEINTSGNITGLQWYYSGTSSLPNNQNITIYLGHSTKTAFATTTDWEPLASLTAVYTGAIPVSGAGWVSITFDTPFAYNGTDNLIVAVDENFAGYDTSNDDFYNTASTTGRSIWYRSDSTNPDPATPPTGTLASFYPNVIFDGIVQACPQPTLLVASSITSSSVDVGWNAGSSETEWEYVIQPQGTGIPTGSGTNITVNPLTISALLPNTVYEVWIRAYCSVTEQSFWSGPLNFRTLCNTYTAPWNYDVETAGVTTNSSILDCWSSNPTGTTASFRWDVDGAGSTPTGSTGPSGANSGVNYFYTESSSGTLGAVAELYTPQIDISSLTDPSLQFFYHMFGATIGELHVDVFDGSSWVNDVDVIVGQQQTDIADAWFQRIVSLSSFTGVIQVRFRAIRGNGITGDISLDDISFDEAPACLPPTNLMVYNITDTTIDFDWTENGSAFDWEYVLQAAGSGTPTGSGIAIDAQPWEGVVSGLTPNTDYEIYIRSFCSASNQSTWFGPVVFTTECATYTVPALENFTTYVPSCWEEADNGDLTAGPSTFGSSNWLEDGFGNVGTTGAVRYNVFTTGANDWILSPLYSIPATGYELKFDAAATQYASTNAPTTAWESDDFVEVLVSTSTTNWTVLYTYNNTNVPSNTGTTNIINLDAYATQDVRFAFRAVEGATNGSADIDFSIDNFEIRLTPSAPPSCSTNVVATPDVSCGNFANALSWDSVSGADGYKITLATTSGGNDILDNVDLGTALTYNFSGSINTTYYFVITPYNGSGDATGCTEVSFTTNANGCYCTSNPTSNDGAGITNVDIVATSFPTTDVTYFDHTATTVDMSQGISNNVQISFATGYTYNTYILIDFNDDFDFNDAGELVFTGDSSSANPTTYNASFIMPATAPLGVHRMRIVTADAMTTVNPCYSGSYGVTLDFNINIIAASCTPPNVTSIAVSHDCINSEFSLDANVTDLGNGTPSITDGVTTWPITATGITQVGPFAYGSSVTLTLLHGSDSACDLSLGTFTYTACPPANDDLCNATPLTLGAATTGNDYTLIAATSETNEPIGSCFSGGITGSVWFSFVAPASGSVEITTDFAGGTLESGDTEIAVYDGTGVTCSDLSTLPAETDCDQDSGNVNTSYGSLLSLTGLTSGTTYYIQVDSYSGVTLGTFGIQVNDVLSSSAFDLTNFRAYPNPVKDILNLEYTSAITSISVFNLLGQEVLSNKVNATSAKIDMSQLNSGAYIVNITIDGAEQVIKVIKE